MKNFIEMRHWDSLPIDRARLLTDIVVNTFTDPAELERLRAQLGDIRGVDVQEVKIHIQAHGRDAKPYGQSLDFWREFLHAENMGDDIPGDTAHPEIFQR